MNANNLKYLTPKYFNIISVNEYDVTIISRNTGHYWYLHNSEYPEKGRVNIFYKNRASHSYHHHDRVNTLRQAVRNIWGHNKWQLNDSGYILYSSAAGKFIGRK